ncbi:hypothetical protein N7478_010295 [Penicillium angulare]|uniref:uncharacterized protein n=1 Tax=Penicillium angulare TaxID=116970 RepID=UPI002540369E|nr:uncharacterized protein N7478_010295 [Penicillium angulare]KAJ5267487.1 hypothetical protein N7478_010295 [Penicillium angulare]
MRFVPYLFTVGLPLTLAGRFQLYDVDGKCRIYSVDNWDCTGTSDPIGNLKGKTCDLKSGVADGPRFMNVSICGHDAGNRSSVATVQLDDTGLIRFQNLQGQTASCTIDASLQVGSECTVGRNTTERVTTTSSTTRTLAVVRPTEIPSPTQKNTTGLATDC